MFLRKKKMINNNENDEKSHISVDLHQIQGFEQILVRIIVKMLKCRCLWYFHKIVINK